MKKMLAAHDLTKTFAQQPVLKGVSLEIAPGTITALIGPNGCGKSTLLRAISLLDPPATGRVNLDEVTYSFPLKQGKSFIAPWPKLTVVFQQLFLWPHLTVRQNLLLPLKGRQKVAQQVDEMVAALEMGEYIDRFPNQISLGQRQRAAIARALLLDPQYILLDEITSALDVEQISLVLNQLLLLKEKGAGILLVTHLIGFARRAADQIIFMKDGAIEDSGGPELLSSPRSPHLMRFLSLIEGAPVSASREHYD